MATHPQTHRIGELVRNSLYQVDEGAVADAILARVRARQLVPEIGFRNDQRDGASSPPPAGGATPVRSFRPSRRARSFHLPERRPTSLHA